MRNGYVGLGGGRWYTRITMRFLHFYCADNAVNYSNVWESAVERLLLAATKEETVWNWQVEVSEAMEIIDSRLPPSKVF